MRKLHAACHVGALLSYSNRVSRAGPGPAPPGAARGGGASQRTATSVYTRRGRGAPQPCAAGERRVCGGMGATGARLRITCLQLDLELVHLSLHVHLLRFQLLLLRRRLGLDLRQHHVDRTRAAAAAGRRRGARRRRHRRRRRRGRRDLHDLPAGARARRGKVCAGEGRQSQPQPGQRLGGPTATGAAASGASTGGSAAHAPSLSRQRTSRRTLLRLRLILFAVCRARDETTRMVSQPAHTPLQRA